ncbi:hypothetical protein K461DRAFT_273628 [Myriangium duriaei CBS 260.36]|uniref:Uncharacterized protein n=1 Tax=Myriangium duriaei CBS 260.36 TaxID=1168546 RepID=A0A9P4JD39_9PEZI|nr:hypothetical protein K461DRAFT_273628 [Myriangium duriaei CBS 260.36]
MTSPVPVSSQADTPLATTAATSAAASAASGKHGKAKRPMLQTPVSASYPSEYPALSTPLTATPTMSRRTEELSFGKSTPISPPAIYKEFLKAHSPAMLSPPTTCGSLSREPSFGSATDTDKTDRADPHIYETEAEFVPPKQPMISRHPSSDSSSSFTSVSSATDSVSTEPRSPVASSAGPSKPKPQSPRVTIPPSGSHRHSSARTPRRLYIPGSPLSSTTIPTPSSARSLLSARGRHSPWSASSAWATSAGGSARSPHPFISARNTPATPRDDKSPLVPISVREVVTRTVTYGRQATTPLSAPPRGKRRKTITQEDLKSQGKSKSKSPFSGSEGGLSSDQSAKEGTPV